ncbi:hypothetical protein AcW1_004601 [Taiwanofungus camphoratus]|nr:hypothetical protein AcW2_006395 [Antrodia cinnamomea]KAI0939639.1 hypothetical protein AcV5_000987 [Antrodia cinnamomea]KAI0959927.1 hypothetical protein AcW1_004601 [Antrodia cinnamomea]
MFTVLAKVGTNWIDKSRHVCYVLTYRQAVSVYTPLFSFIPWQNYWHATLRTSMFTFFELIVFLFTGMNVKRPRILNMRFVQLCLMFPRLHHATFPSSPAPCRLPCVIVLPPIE